MAAADYSIYIDAPATAELRGDIVHLTFVSNGAPLTLALTRNAAHTAIGACLGALRETSETAQVLQFDESGQRVRA